MRISITLLSYEHGVIRQVIDCVADVVRRGEVDRFRKLLAMSNTFFVDYMDHFHHGKEENFLFPFVKERRQEEATIERLLNDHRMAREILGQLTDSDDGEEITDEEAYYRVAQEMVNHVTKHINFEEDHFFPRVEDRISLDDDERLYAGYESFMREKFNEDFARKQEDFSFRLQSKILPAGHFNGVI